MRKDPPFDIPYLYATYLLELAQNQGCKVINDPRSIRDVNEKLFTAWFPQCCPPTLVTSLISQLRAFLSEHKEIIVKPLNNMGGQGVFKLTQKSDNINATLEILTKNGKFPIMAQRFIPEIIKGDKRILMINGTPYPYALSRIPQAGEIRANLASGGDGVGSELTERDIWICKQVGPTLKENGLFFVGLDVIGDYLTEINVTSPTCVREIEAAFNVNICEEIFNSI
jgi:glutathione synthase